MHDVINIPTRKQSLLCRCGWFNKDEGVSVHGMSKQSQSKHHFEDVLRCIARQLQQSRTACQHHQLGSSMPQHWPVLVPIHVSMLATLTTHGICSTIYYYHLLQVWSARLSELLGKHMGHVAPVTCLALDGNFLISGSEDCTVRLWDLVPASRCGKACLLLCFCVLPWGSKLSFCCALLAAWCCSAFLSDFPCCSCMNASFSGFSGWHNM